MDIHLIGQQPPRDDRDEAIARLAMFVAQLTHTLATDQALSTNSAAFIVVGATEILDRFGPIDTDHQFDGQQPSN